MHLDSALDYLRVNSGRDGISQVVILHDGNCVYRGEHADAVHGIWSATKSFVSTLLGLLIEDGRLTLDTPVAAALPELSRTFPTITYRHLATMTSGYRAVGDDQPQGDYRHGPSLTPFAPGDSPLFAPGTAYAYWDSAMNLFAYALTRVAGRPLDELLQERIAGPLGITFTWPHFDHQGLRVCGGAGNHDKHLKLCARDLARFGQLFLNRGMHEGRRLVPEKWCDEATRVHVSSALPQRGGISEGPGHYGLNWWVNVERPGAARKWPGAPEDTYCASGYNNNDLFVIPSRRLVVVRMGLDQQTDGAISDEVYGQFLAMVTSRI